MILDDEVGALSRISEIFTRNGANIIEVTHQRIFGVLSAKSIKTDIEFEIRDIESRDRMLDDLDSAGYSYDLMTLSGHRPPKRDRD